MGLPFLKLLLAAIDVAVLCLVVALLVSNCKTKQYGARIWLKAFHVLVLVWLVLRGMFWVLSITTREEWHSISFGLLYWLPNPLQFGSFLLLPMAYSKVLSPSNLWEVHSRTVGRAYVTLVSSMLVYMVGFAVAQAMSDNRRLRCVTADKDSENAPATCYDMELNNQAFRVLTGFCFFALAAGVAGYGFQMSKLTSSQNRAQLIFQPRALAALNCFLVAVFLSKGAYQISSVLSLWYLPDIPLQGSEDVCLLNFCVFFFWDYVPTVWLLLVMEGTTGEHVGTSVVKAVFPARILANFGDDMPNLPDYGLFREIKAAAARQAARSERSGSRASSTGLQYSYPSSNGMGLSPRAISNNDLKNWHGNQGGGGSSPYFVSHHSRENLWHGGGDSSNACGFYGTVTTAAAGSSVGSSLGGMTFVTSPVTPSDPHDGRTGGLFNWLFGWRKSSIGEEAGAGGDAEDRDGRGGGGGGGPPTLWQRNLEHNDDCVSCTRSATALNKSESRSLGNGSNRDTAGGGGEGGAVARWWRGVLDSLTGGGGGGGDPGNTSMGGGDREGAVGEASLLWKSHGSGVAGGNSHLSFGELSRAAEVTYPLRGYETGAERHVAGEWGHDGAAERRGRGSGRVGAARGGEPSSSLAGREGSGGPGAGVVAPVGVRQAVGWSGGVENRVIAAQQRQRQQQHQRQHQQQQQQQQQQQHYIERRGGDGGVGILPRMDPLLGPMTVDPYGRQPPEEYSAAAEQRGQEVSPSSTGGAAVDRGYGGGGYVDHASAAHTPTAMSHQQQGRPAGTYQTQHVYDMGTHAPVVDIGRIGGGGSGGVRYHPEAAYRGDSTDLQERRREHQGYPQQQNLQGVGAGVEPRQTAKAATHGAVGGNMPEERIGDREYRAYRVPDQYRLQHD
eukprot:g20641.t2